MPSPKSLAAVALAASLALAGAASAQDQNALDPARADLPGKAIFDQRCAMCHLHPEMTRARPVAEIRTYPAARIKESLTTGVMKAQGASLSDEEKDQVAAYLAADTTSASSSSTTSPSTTSAPTTH